MDRNTSPTADTAQAAGQQPPAQAAISDGQVPNETPNVSTEELQRQIAELRKENAAHRRKANEQAQAAQAAEDARLAEQGQFKQLAEQHASRIKELEPVAESYAQLAALVSGQIEAQIKDWPAEIKAFDPGKDAPIEQRLTWIEKSKPIIDKLQQTALGSKPGNSPNPRPSGGTPETERNKFLEQLRRSGKYGA